MQSVQTTPLFSNTSVQTSSQKSARQAALCHIFARLPPQDILNQRLVLKDFRSAVDSPYFWHLYLPHCPRPLPRWMEVIPLLLIGQKLEWLKPEGWLEHFIQTLSQKREHTLSCNHFLAIDHIFHEKIQRMTSVKVEMNVLIQLFQLGLAKCSLSYLKKGTFKNLLQPVMGNLFYRDRFHLVKTEEIAPCWIQFFTHLKILFPLVEERGEKIPQTLCLKALTILCIHRQNGSFDKQTGKELLLQMAEAFNQLSCAADMKIRNEEGISCCDLIDSFDLIP